MSQYYVLGTTVQFNTQGENGREAVSEALDRLTEIDEMMSVFREDSEIAKINQGAGEFPQKVSHDTFFVIKKAVEYCALSKGAFDPTIRPLARLWAIGTDQICVPEYAAIKQNLALVNFRDIQLNEGQGTVGLKNKGQALDLGGIAKGFAADEVKNIFLKYGIRNAVIDLGGNIYVLGNKAEGIPWRVGIQDPFSQRGKIVGYVELADKSVVTSGNYERYFIDRGQRYHHILDPRTGYPSHSGVVSVTMVTDYSVDGDALSTCAYVLGLERGMRLVESLPGVDALFVTADKKIYTTSGLQELFTLANPDFLLN